MKFELITDGIGEEKVVVYAHKETELVKKIKELVNGDEAEFNGFMNREIFRVNFSDVYCFVVENNKIYAITHKKKFRVKCRLYQLEDQCSENFVKINQSCIVNLKKIQRFDTSLSGSLKVRLKNGYVDYVSRRNIKKVKERLGL